MNFTGRRGRGKLTPRIREILCAQSRERGACVVKLSVIFILRLGFGNGGVDFIDRFAFVIRKRIVSAF